MNKRVLLGMSGGIDSSVSAILLQEQGYEVVGVTFLFANLEEQNKKIVKDAKTLAIKLNIRHLIVDLIKEFEENVVTYFIDEYKNGRTPFPCAFCNPKIKFHYLENIAKKENCSFISTGHYALIKDFNGKKYVYQGVDPDKDQSFFLWGLRSELIEKLIFPLGSFTKDKIRELALQKGFTKLSKKKDSLGICFIEGNNYREFLEKKGIISTPGNFVNKNGEILGQHSGIINYTIGQRRGLGLNLNFPVFVADIRLDDNEIVLGKYDDLYRKRLALKGCQYVDIQEIKTENIYTVKVRYRLQLSSCNLNILTETRAEVELLQSEAMIANGQTAVFYDGQRLLGGGFIEQSF
jgi:tRNA-specific 2-thiouridylase